MRIKNLSKDYATITGGLVKQGETVIIADWELPLIKALGQEVEIVEENVAEVSKRAKKNKKC